MLYSSVCMWRDTFTYVEVSNVKDSVKVVSCIYPADFCDFRRSCNSNVTGKYRKVEFPMLIQVSDPPIDDRPYGIGRSRTSSHETAVDRVHGSGRRYHYNSACRNGVNLGQVISTRWSRLRRMDYIVLSVKRLFNGSFGDMLNCVCRADNLGVAGLALRRPQRYVGQDTSMGIFELQECVSNITSRLFIKIEDNKRD